MIAAFIASCLLHAGDTQVTPRGPDFVTSQGLAVYDPWHRTSILEVERWIAATIAAAPVEEGLAILDLLPKARLVITQPKETTEDECGKPSPGFVIVGCAKPREHEFVLSWRPCSGPEPRTAGIFAHEIGHLLGYYHQDAWYVDDNIENTVSRSVCR